MSTELENLINAIREAQREYDRLVFDEVLSHELGPPADPRQIERLEEALGVALPRSYRAFLELHDGWSDFAGGAKLLSVQDHASEWVRQRIEDWGELVDKAHDPFASGAVPVLLGTDESSFLVLDPSSRRADGEMDLVLYDYMQEERRFPNFPSYLEYRLAILRALIERETEGLPDDDAPSGSKTD
jgi:hypothetical protein